MCDKSCTFSENRTKEHLLHHVKAGIPTRIYYEDLELLPVRANFCDEKLAGAFGSSIKAGKPLLFLSNTATTKVDFRRGHEYNIYMFGILPCGSRMCVILTDIPLDVRVRVPNGVDPKDFTRRLRSFLAESGCYYSGMKNVMLDDLHGFSPVPNTYIQINFAKMIDRTTCITALGTAQALNGGNPLVTANDDPERSYFNKVAREFRFATAGWNRITDYEMAESATTLNCKYTIRVNVANFKRIKKTQMREYKAPTHPLSHVMDKDLTVLAIWDIETYRTIGLSVPTPADQDFTIRTICTTYGRHYNKEPLFSFCACIDEAAASDRLLTVVCRTEERALIAHMEMFRRMAPEVLGAFNGGVFDWPMYKEKCRRYKLLMRLKRCMSALPLNNYGKWADTEESIGKWDFRRVEVKIDAENVHVLPCVANFVGFIDTDVMPVFLKLYPRAEVRKVESLNFFLAKNNLESKEDMPYQKMFAVFARAIDLEGASQECHCAAAPGCAGCAYRKLIDTEKGGPCCACSKRAANLRDIADVNYYCAIDCVRPLQLYAVRSIVQDRRELACMSYVSMYDAFYRADGMKVCNFIGANSVKRRVANTTQLTENRSNKDKDHYPGAWVFPPNRGLHADGYMWIYRFDENGVKHRIRVKSRPITGMDFASLYPSIMMTYNESTDKCVDAAEVERLIAAGYTLHYTGKYNYERGEKKGQACNTKHVGEGWFVRHNGVINDGDKTITDYYKLETIIADGQTIKHRVDEPLTPEQEQIIAEAHKIDRKIARIPVYGRDPLPGERMGIFPYCMNKLFNKRVPVKARFLHYKDLVERMEKDGVHSAMDGDVEISLEDAEFYMNAIDAKQRSIKVLSNTFYGQTGNFRSPVYNINVAAGITCAGQQNIKKVAGFVRGLGFDVHYGDTDSLYLSPHERYFVEIDAAYDAACADLARQYEGVPIEACPSSEESAAYKAARTAARTHYWEAQVRLTMTIMNDLKGKISDFLQADNGTIFLNMAYEEVLYPALLCGMKKYLGFEHMKIINFNPKACFIRGIETIKQGHAQITRDLANEFMMEVLSPGNEFTVMDLIKAKIRKFYECPADPALFSQKMRYKPEKKNVAAHTFYDRMVAMHDRHAGDMALRELYTPPEAGDKFDYVIVKRPQRYDLQGRIIKMGKGDYMEYVHVFNASQSGPEPLVLDRDYYMKNTIVGIFARFISDYEDFQPPEGTYDTENKEEYKELDSHCIKLACKYLENYCDEITGNVHGAAAKVGSQYRSSFKVADKRVRADMLVRYGTTGAIMRMDTASADVAPSTAMINRIKQSAMELNPVGSLLTQQATEIITRVKAKKVSVYAMARLYTGRIGLSRVIARNCDAREARIISRLYEIINPAIEIIRDYERSFVTMIEETRIAGRICDDEDIEFLNELSAGEYAIMKEVHDLLIKLAAIYAVKNRALAIHRETLALKATLTNDVVEPADVYSVIKKESVAAPVLPAYEWQ